MLSRVAQNLYWMGRYVERAENTARLINVNTGLLMDLPKNTENGWEALVDILGMSSEFAARIGEAGERQVLEFMIGDKKNSGSIVSSLNSARENCRTVRGILPRKIWEELSLLCEFAEDNLNKGLTKRGRHSYLQRVIRGSEGFIGIISNSLSRGEAFDFLRIGRNLERADMTTRILDVRSASLLSDDINDLEGLETRQWVSVLNSLSAYQMYRQYRHTSVRRAEVLLFLLEDAQFPRAFRHCIDVIEECAGSLKNNASVLKKLRALVTKLDRTRVEKLDQPALQQFMDELQLGIIEVHNAVRKTWFMTAQSQQQQ